MKDREIENPDNHGGDSDEEIGAAHFSSGYSETFVYEFREITRRRHRGGERFLAWALPCLALLGVDLHGLALPYIAVPWLCFAVPYSLPGRCRVRSIIARASSKARTRYVAGV